MVTGKTVVIYGSPSGLFRAIEESRRWREGFDWVGGRSGSSSTNGSSSICSGSARKVSFDYEIYGESTPEILMVPRGKVTVLT